MATTYCTVALHGGSLVEISKVAKAGLQYNTKAWCLQCILDLANHNVVAGSSEPSKATT